MKIGLKTGVYAAVLVAALALLACGGNDKQQDEDKRGSGSVSDFPTFTPTPTTAAAADTATPGPAGGLPEPNEGAVLERLVAAKVGLDAPVEQKGLNGRGEMENPSGKDVVAWYDFSEFPGFGGNAVFSSHVDWFTGELGPFGRIRDLENGDEVLVKLSDGMEMKYRVVSSVVYEAAKAPVQEIVARTEKDTLTLITCEGTFSRAAQDYSHRRIVRAERVS